MFSSHEYEERSNKLHGLFLSPIGLKAWTLNSVRQLVSKIGETKTEDPWGNRCLAAEVAIQWRGMFYRALQTGYIRTERASLRPSSAKFVTS